MSQTWHESSTGNHQGLIIDEAGKNIAVTYDKADAAVIVACVNGCAGLNPAGYRGVVEALHFFMEALDSGVLVRDISLDADANWALKMVRFVSELYKAKQALALAEAEA